MEGETSKHMPWLGPVDTNLMNVLCDIHCMTLIDFRKQAWSILCIKQNGNCHFNCIFIWYSHNSVSNTIWNANDNWLSISHFIKIWKGRTEEYTENESMEFSLALIVLLNYNFGKYWIKLCSNDFSIFHKVHGSGVYLIWPGWEGRNEWHWLSYERPWGGSVRSHHWIRPVGHEGAALTFSGLQRE